MTYRAIYYNNEDSRAKVLIETSTFDNISTPTSGGATVHFHNQGEIVENKVCAKNSQLNSKTPFSNMYSFGIYSYHRVTENEASKNYVFESSFTQCSSKEGGAVFYHIYGDVQCSKNNISRTDAKFTPCTYFYDINKDAKISFSSFNNNTGHSSDRFCFEHSGRFQYFYSYCDIFYNEYPRAILYFYSNCNFSSCNIFDNADTNTNYLFYMYNSKTLTISNCFIKNDKASSNYPANLNSDSIGSKIINLVVGINCKQYVILQIQQNRCECSLKATCFHISTMESLIPIASK